ncbi:MAG TPA: hypothetical protein DCL61_25755 [Cyanobacteria bacterium UBA12227]|nr:hypothetical protein [Cyanobacteria bacterium UBA12227]HAX86405.1 hypothetical protein [Cyanobacteria bacterium UBA11370]HBY77400.1 hypothetical protein [Cyanobacteria bacterium UBA11148]
MLKLLILVLLGIYGYGAWKFWKGFERTNFNRSLPNKIYLSLLWPALIVTNTSYRKNFNKALKGR